MSTPCLCLWVHDHVLDLGTGILDRKSSEYSCPARGKGRKREEKSRWGGLAEDASAGTASLVAKGEGAARATSAETPSEKGGGDPAKHCAIARRLSTSPAGTCEKQGRERGETAEEWRFILPVLCCAVLCAARRWGGSTACWEEEIRSFELLSMVVLEFWSRPAAGEQGVAETMRTRSDVDEICICHDWFGDDDAEELAAALAQNTSLKKLYLVGFSIGARGLRSIAEALKVNSTLTHCSLGDIMIGDAGAEIVADALASNSSLIYLSLSACGVSAVGLKAIAKALEISTTLQCLSMVENSKIGDAGASILADALVSTKSLFTTHLDECGIGEQGAMALGRAWGTNLALPLLTALIGGVDGAYEEATRIRGLVLERRDKLVAFGMATIPRLGGIRAANAGPNTRSSSSSKVCVIRFMNKDVLRLIGEAYGDY